MISRPFALVGFSFTAALLVLNLMSDSLWLLAAAVVVGLMVTVLVRGFSKRATYAVCFVSVLAACVSFLATEKLVYSAAVDLVQKDAFVTAEITDIEPDEGGVYYMLRSVTVGGESSCHKMRLWQKDLLDADIGDKITFQCNIELIGKNSESRRFYKSRGLFLNCIADSAPTVTKAENKPLLYYIKRVRDYAADTLNLLIDSQSGALSAAMLTGEKSFLSPQAVNSFKSCGLSHILAVSGLHMNIIVLALYKFLCILSKHTKRFGAALCIPVAVIYAVLTGLSVSAVRACVMICIILLGVLISRRSDSLNSLGLAALVITLANPYAVTDLSFMLSFSATLGIVICQPIVVVTGEFLQTKIRFRPLSLAATAVADSALISLAATAFVLPVNVLMTGELSLMFMPANLAVFWAVPVFMVLSSLTVLLSLLPFGFAADLFATLCDLVGRYLSAVARLMSASAFSVMRFDSFPMKLWLAATVFAIALSVLIFKNKRRAYSFCAGFACVTLLVTCGADAVENAGRVNVTAVDVDDGSCFVISRGTQAVVIGCKGSDYDVKSALTDLGITKIKLMLVPHSVVEDSFYLDEICSSFEVERCVVSPGTELDSMPQSTTVTDSFSYDFYGCNLEYRAEGEYGFCRLGSESSSVLFLFGYDTPEVLVGEEKQADFLFSVCQPPEWLNTSDYVAVIVSAGGNTAVNSSNVYSTFDNSSLTLSFNRWGQYEINSF